MNVKRFLGLALFTYLMCAAFAVVNQKDTPPGTHNYHQHNQHHHIDTTHHPCCLC